MGGAAIVGGEKLARALGASIIETDDTPNQNKQA